jgi:hypothetical protein
MHRRPFALLAVVLLVFVTNAVGAGRLTPTSEKERKKVVELATKLEDDPLSKKAKGWRKEVLTIIGNAPDLRVEPCRALLGDLLLTKRLEAQQLYVQLEISTAKYLVEHPEAASDRERALAGGLEGVLRTYDAMHHKNPSLTIPSVDELVERQARDGLDEYVRETLGDCSREP